MTTQKEDFDSEDSFFDVREAKDLKDLYSRMRIIDKKTGENVDWRSMNPDEYLPDAALEEFDDDESLEG